MLSGTNGSLKKQARTVQKVESGVRVLERGRANRELLSRFLLMYPRCASSGDASSGGLGESHVSDEYTPSPGSYGSNARHEDEPRRHSCLSPSTKSVSPGVELR